MNPISISGIILEMITEQFKQAYAKLNPRQKEAVDAIEGPVVVIAGPGTGKTQILTLRIANILAQTDTSASSILALTFTEAATANMRTRLVNLIGSRGYYVAIATFHGFANRVIQEYPEHFPEIVGSEPVTQAEQVAILREIIEGEDLEHLKPFGNPFFMVPKILSGIQHLKRENFSPALFERHLKEEEKAFSQIPDLYHEKGAYKGKMKGEYRKRLEELEKSQELGRLYASYQKLMRERRRYDFDDMILEVIRALEGREELLLTLEERYQYLLVDEHQDTNGAQNRLLELLASFHPMPNLFVVGDEKQAIYRFQGASLDNFLYFKNKYPEAKVISLESNYRSPQWLLDSAETLIVQNKNTIKAPLTAVSREVLPLSGPPPSQGELVGVSSPGGVSGGIPLPASPARGGENTVGVYEFQLPEGELTYLADTIAARISAGVPAREIAVLYRENGDAYPIAEFLEKRGLPVVVESNQDVLSDPEVRKLINLFTATLHFGEDAYLVPAIQADFIGVEPLDLYHLLDFREVYNRTHTGKPKLTLYKLLRWISQEVVIASSANGGASAEGRSSFGGKQSSVDSRNDKGGLLDYLDLEQPEQLTEFYAFLVRARKAAANEHCLKVFELVVRESGLLAYILKQPTHFEKMAKLTRIFEEARRAASGKVDYRLSDFLAHLDILKEHNVPVKSKESYAPSSVRLMTAHSAKGLEFDCVFIVGATDGHWGNRRSHGGFHLPYRTSVKVTDEEENEDERRLFYMALTRAKNEVSISYAMRDKQERLQVPSQFIGEIREDLRVTFPTEVYEEKFRAGREILFAPRETGLPRLQDREFLRELFLRRGFAATHLNNYLSCPWKYFYQNLIRVPQVPTRSQVYGIAVHSALEKFFKEKKRIIFGEIVSSTASPRNDKEGVIASSANGGASAEGRSSSGGKQSFGIQEIAALPAVAHNDNGEVQLLLAEFERVLNKQPVMSVDREAILAKGRESLPAYYERYHAEWNYNVETEVNIRGVILSPEVRLTGKLDKLEFGDSPKETIVVDYKTGEPKSRNHIEGKTASSDGDYYRQLTFYRILIEGNEERPLRMRAAEIDFVEPNERGIFKKERFEIPDEAVGELKETILRVADEILNLKFWDKRCGEKDCEFCRLRE